MSRRRLPLVNLGRFADLRARRDHAAARERELAEKSGTTPPQWYRIANAADGVAKIYIYDEIGYWGVTASDFVVDLEAITKPKISVHINSPGGECYDGLAIYNALVRHAAEIDVQVDGLAASAASFIAMAGDTIEVCKTAEMMIHDASGLCWGNAAEMERMVEQLNRMSDNIAGIYAERAGGEASAWRAVMREERWYSAKEAVAAKLADKVVGDVKPEDKPDNGTTEPPEDATTRKVFDLSVFRYAGRAAAPELPREESPRARVRWRQHVAYDPLQPRGDDGKWIDGLPDGVSGRNLMTIDDWFDSYGDVIDETKIDNGLNVISLKNGETQLAFDPPGDSDHRFVIFDCTPDDLEGLARTINDALRFDNVDAPGTYSTEFRHPDDDELWLSTFREGEDLTLTFAGAGDGGVDVEIYTDTEQGEELVNALFDQATKARDVLEDGWRDVVRAITSGDSSRSSEPTSEWSEYAGTLLPTDDDPLDALRKAFA